MMFLAIGADASSTPALLCDVKLSGACKNKCEISQVIRNFYARYFIDVAVCRDCIMNPLPLSSVNKQVVYISIGIADIYGVAL